jgi:hypothetical protein
MINQLLLAVLLSISPPAKAAECETIDSCLNEIREIRTRLLEIDPSRKTETGHTFYRDNSVEGFGEAWRDESGMIWADVAQKNGSVMFLTGNKAQEYCQSIKANLPTLSDLDRLASYMLRSEVSEYQDCTRRPCRTVQYQYKFLFPQVLPHLQALPEGGHWDRFLINAVGAKGWLITATNRGARWEELARQFGSLDWSGLGYPVRCVKQASGTSMRPSSPTSNETCQSVEECNGQIKNLEMNIRELQGELRRTTTGHVFIRDYSLWTLGEAWRDESGLVWGDEPSPDYRLPPQEFESDRYCFGGPGVRFPSPNDFERLRNYMGGKEHYSPQILPHFGNESFLSKGALEPIPGSGYYRRAHTWFDSMTGRLHNSGYSYTGPNLAYRCVYRPQPL